MAHAQPDFLETPVAPNLAGATLVQRTSGQGSNLLKQLLLTNHHGYDTEGQPVGR